MKIKPEITDEKIGKIVDDYKNSLTCKEWSEIGGVPNGFENGMRYMRDLDTDNPEHKMPDAKVRAPYKCPICDGRGTVPVDFYYQQTTEVSTRCKSCSGNGIVWGG